MRTCSTNSTNGMTIPKIIQISMSFALAVGGKLLMAPRNNVVTTNIPVKQSMTDASKYTFGKNVAV